MKPFHGKRFPPSPVSPLLPEETPSRRPVPSSSPSPRPSGVSADELLGLTPVQAPRAPKTARLLKRLQRIEELPPADQRTVLKLVDALVDARRRTAPAKRARKAS